MKNQCGIIKINADFEYWISNNGICILKYLGGNAELVFPDSIDGLPVTGIDEWIFLDKITGCYFDNTIKSIYIPENLTNIDYETFMGCELLEDISVHPNNLKYSSDDGVLYDKDKVCLIQYPMGKESATYKIPDGVSSICVTSFFESQLVNIIIPDSVYDFGLCLYMDSVSAIEHPFSKSGILHGNFYDCILNFGSMSKIDGTIQSHDFSNEDLGNNVFCHCKNITISCHIGSAAHQFAINNHIPFYLLSGSTNNVVQSF